MRYLGILMSALFFFGVSAHSASAANDKGTGLTQPTASQIESLFNLRPTHKPDHTPMLVADAACIKKCDDAYNICYKNSSAGDRYKCTNVARACRNKCR